MTANKIALCLIAALFLVAGCAPKSYVVLQEDKDGTTGAVTVSNAQGTQLLDKKGYGIDLPSGNKPLEAPYKVSDEKIKADFEQALSAAPDPPVDFLLYFEFGTAILTNESQLNINNIIATIHKRKYNKIGIIGHTDSSGESTANYQLGLSRAESVRKTLLDAGVQADDIIDVISHGESNPLVKTAKGVYEPRNRRVEVIVW
jgi:peptidoglycan-associated lipoprotein